MRTTIIPTTGIQFKPAFLGVERSLSDVVDNFESLWDSQMNKNSMSYADFKETDEAYFFALNMPGVSKKELDLEINDDRVVISGTRKKSFFTDTEETQKVSRTVPLPQDVDESKVQAHLEDGVLYLAMPKMEKKKPKKIELVDEINSGVWSNLLASNEV